MTRRLLLASLLVSSGWLRGADTAAPAGAPATTPAAAAIPIVPTVIESSGPAEMVSTATETIFTFRDRVTITATNLKLTCDELIVVAKRTGDAKATLGKQENFKSLLATGNVHLVQLEREANCDRAEILPGEDKVTLIGNPATVRSVDGTYAGSGPQLTFYRGQQRATITAPRFVLPPIKDLGPGKDKGKATPKADSATPVIAPATSSPASDQPAAPTTITVPSLNPTPPAQPK